jgi:hypothetical protein
MNVKDKEFYDLRNQFEKSVKALTYVHSRSLDRVSKNEKVPTGIFYNDGYINTLFHVYMLGYENAKCLARVGEFDD